MDRYLGALLGLVTLVLFGTFPVKERPQEPVAAPTRQEVAELVEPVKVATTSLSVYPTPLPAIAPTASSSSSSPTPPPTPTPEPPSAPPAPQPEPLYISPPKELASINADTRAALVNILCIGAAPLKSTSGSGVFVSADGLILTNAHIGQYVLLSDAGASVSCVARSGSPAVAEWRLKTVYFPISWAQKHARTLLENSPTGTGEDDFALLRVEGAEDAPVPFLPIDAREEALTADVVVLGAYPAEFVTASEVRRYLQALSAYATIGTRYTFGSDALDVISLGANPLAQQGSSGGAVVNAWGYLIGIITTTTVGDDTGKRDLRAITLGHIQRSLTAATGFTLDDVISREPLDDLDKQTAEAADTLLDALP